ncbi:MAG: hypothetical protein R3F20_02085 [Planctomycetota bacterium]
MTGRRFHGNRILFPVVWGVSLGVAVTSNDGAAALPLLAPFGPGFSLGLPADILTILVALFGLGVFSDLRGHSILDVTVRTLGPIVAIVAGCLAVGNPDHGPHVNLAWLLSVRWFDLSVVAHAIIPARWLPRLLGDSNAP